MKKEFKNLNLFLRSHGKTDFYLDYGLNKSFSEEDCEKVVSFLDQNTAASNHVEKSRGAILEINSGGIDLIIRKYHRGGLISKFNSNLHFLKSYYYVRPVLEFKALNKMLSAGLKVPRPRGFIFRDHMFFYESAIILDKIDNTIPLQNLSADVGFNLFKCAEQAGHVAKLALKQGICHTDLHPANVLINKDGVYLIDFDKPIFFKSGIEFHQNNMISRWRRFVDKYGLGDDLLFGFEKGIRSN